MAKNRKSKKKKSSLKIIFTLVVFVLIIIFSYIIFNNFIVPAWERYIEKPIKEVPYKEKEIKEVQPVPTEKMVEVNLYFSDSQAMYLVAEKRKIPQTPSLVRQAVIELIKGPEMRKYLRIIPEEAVVS